MGYNTTCVIYNDAIDDIETDPAFGKNLAEAIRTINRVPDRHLDVRAGCHCNAAMVVESHHADQIVVVAVGGNLGQVLGSGGNWRNTPTQILNYLSQELGCEVVKDKARRKLEVELDNLKLQYDLVRNRLHQQNEGLVRDLDDLRKENEHLKDRLAQEIGLANRRLIELRELRGEKEDK